MSIVKTDDERQEQVKQALRRFHDLAYLGQSPLAAWRVVRQQLPARDGPPDPIVLGRAVQGLLTTAIELLKPDPPPPSGTAPPWRAYRILDLAFRQGEPPPNIYKRLCLGHSHYYRERSDAIAALTIRLCEWEQTACRGAETKEKIANLPTSTYTRLFGVEAQIAAVVEALQDSDRRWLVVVDGLGGAGKTALACEAAKLALEAGEFAGLAWQTAQLQEFKWGEIQLRVEPALTVERLLDGIAQQIGLPRVAHLPAEEKRRTLQATLRQRPYLLVVDNLETAEDYQTIVQELWALTKPSKALITSRHRLDRYDTATSVHLRPLDKRAAGAFIRYHALERGVEALHDADEEVIGPIYRATGGNPLAIKLVVGQATSRPLSQVVERLAQAKGDAEQLYRFIYWASWEMLSRPARQVLLSMPYLSVRGGPWQAVADISEVEEEESLVRAVDELVALSLLDAGGGLEKRYSIHQLTRNFVLSELVGMAGKGWGTE